MIRAAAASSPPALAMLLLEEVPAGARALDALLKEAPVDLVSAGTIQGGRYLILVEGEVDPVERAFFRGIEVAGACLVDRVLLPNADGRILRALRDRKASREGSGDTLGVLEAATPPAILRAAEAALKGTGVDLLELRVAEGLGGKGLATLWGETADVEAALELAGIAVARAEHPGLLSCSIVRSADSGVVRSFGAAGSRFFGEFRG